jgi:hypothetical protein
MTHKHGLLVGALLDYQNQLFFKWFSCNEHKIFVPQWCAGSAAGGPGS